MPLYEYVCPDCGLRFELLRPLRQASEAAPCPTCQSDAGRVPSTFCALSQDESGLTSSIGGNSCASCGAPSCDTCAL